MSEYRRRAMMRINKKPLQEGTPVEDGLIFWLDGKDVDSNSSYWSSSTLVNSLVQNFRLKYSSTNTVKNQGKCMTITGTGKNAGASEQTGNGNSSDGRIQPNIFLGYSTNHPFSFDVFFNVTSLPSSSISEHRIVGGTWTWGDADANYRYTLVCTGDKRIMFGQYINDTWRRIYFDTLITLGYHHIVVNVDCTNNKLTAFLDGNISCEDSASYGCPNGTHSNAIGLARYVGLNNTSSDDASVIGDFYSLTYYNRILTDAEVNQNYEFYKNRYIE